MNERAKRSLLLLFSFAPLLPDYEKLDVCRKLDLIATTPTDDNKAILERIAQMLTKLIKSLRAIE